MRSTVKIKLEDQPADTAVETPVWCHVASEGEFKGYRGGTRPFAFTRKTFEEIVANFKANAGYSGTTDLIAWDFDHASATDPLAGDRPFSGAPAQGWAQDLKVQDGADGKAELWALTRWLEPAKSYVKDGRYKFASVVVVFDCTHPITNQKIGAVLESIALTNNPFIEGLNPLAASRGEGANSVQLGDYVGNCYIEPARNTEHAVQMLRAIFGLSELEGADRIIQEIVKVQSYLAAGGTPLGVDLDKIIGAMRLIFNLPTLSSNEEVFFETQKLLDKMIEEMPDETEQTPAPGASAPVATSKEKEMELTAELSKLMGVKADPHVVLSAVQNTFALLGQIAEVIGLSKDANQEAVLAGARSFALGKADVGQKLEQLLSAIGIQDSAGAVNKVAELMQQAQRLQELMPELAGLKAKAAETEEEEIKKDVEETMAASKYLGLQNEGGLRTALTSLRKQSKDEYRKQYPKPTAEQLAASRGTPAAGSGATPPAHLAHLTTVLASNGLGERKITTNADGSITLSAPGRAEAGGGAGGGGTRQRVELAKDAPNRHARVCSWVRRQPGGDKLTFAQVHEQATRMLSDDRDKFEIIDAA